MSYEFHRLNDDGIKKSEAIAKAFTEITTFLGTLCPESREFSIAKTKLEEACFFSKKAMAVQKENQALQVK